MAVYSDYEAQRRVDSAYRWLDLGGLVALFIFVVGLSGLSYAIYGRVNPHTADKAAPTASAEKAPAKPAADNGKG